MSNSSVDQKITEKSFQKLKENKKLEENKAKHLFFEYFKSNDQNDLSNCCLCFL